MIDGGGSALGKIHTLTTILSKLDAAEAREAKPRHPWRGIV
jgi:hypothetical protein